MAQKRRLFSTSGSGDSSDKDYLSQKQEVLELRQKVVSESPPSSVDLDHAEALLSDFPGLWRHPRMNDEKC